jgi:hypothetical protein
MLDATQRPLISLSSVAGDPKQNGCRALFHGRWDVGMDQILELSHVEQFKSQELSTMCFPVPIEMQKYLQTHECASGVVANGAIKVKPRETDV